MLIAPEKQNSLAHIAPYVGSQKIELPPGYSKSEMKRFRDERFEEFNRYAICDAEITARYVSAVFNRFETLGIRCPVPTIGSAGVRLLKTLLPYKELREFLGKDTSQNSEKRHRNAYTFRNAAMMDFAAGCFHGGLNSIYRVGYSPIGLDVVDVDLAGAYPTALAALGYPNWASARYTRSLDDLAVINSALTFAQVLYRFPPSTRYPCLAIRSSKQRGLIYPLTGEAWCCGPELVCALNMGAEIEVIHGYRVDWAVGRPQPFAIHAQMTTAGRERAKEAKDHLLEQIYKALAVSTYGKTAQGVSGQRPIADDIEHHRVFSSWDGEVVDLPPG